MAAITLNVRVTGRLGDFVSANVGAQGAYENVSEYVRDLIRRDMERADQVAFDRLNAELRSAFADPDEALVDMDVEDVIRRGRARAQR